MESYHARARDLVQLIIKDVRYSDVKNFYLELAGPKGLSATTVSSVHCLLHPAFDMAVRDDVIRKNPTNGALRDVMAAYGKNKGVRHALTIEQQREFMDYVRKDPVYCKWDHIFTILFGTGMRISEAAGLRWDDVDFEKEFITVRHQVVYLSSGAIKERGFRLHEPKTDSGIRTIPMLDEVKEALEAEYDEQEYRGFSEAEIDGLSGFVFMNRDGGFITGQTVNRAIRNIVANHNAEEEVRAEKEKREPFMLPSFSCHIMRHTFATHLCETDANIKAIQSIMGHADIKTTMDIYAEATERKKQEAINRIENPEMFF